MIFAGADWRFTHPAPRPAASRGSCCASTVSTPIAMCSALHGLQVTTKWTCGAFAMARSMPLTWAAHWPPEQVAGEAGLFGPVPWVGDHFQIPTVGIAVDPTRIPLDNPGAAGAGARANQRALLTIAERPQLAVDYIASFLGRLTREEVQRYYERYISPYFTSDGRVDKNVARFFSTRSTQRSPPNSASPRHPLTRCTSTSPNPVHRGFGRKSCRTDRRVPCGLAATPP